jgi:hypothetical protein
MEVVGLCNILSHKTDRRELLGKPRHRWKNNVIIDLKERLGMWAGFKRL